MKILIYWSESNFWINFYKYRTKNWKIIVTIDNMIIYSTWWHIVVCTLHLCKPLYWFFSLTLKQTNGKIVIKHYKFIDLALLAWNHPEDNIYVETCTGIQILYSVIIEFSWIFCKLKTFWFLNKQWKDSGCFDFEILTTKVFNIRK
jgi:hypothetical protein